MEDYLKVLNLNNPEQKKQLKDLIKHSVHRNQPVAPNDSSSLSTHNMGVHYAPSSSLIYSTHSSADLPSDMVQPCPNVWTPMPKISNFHGDETKMLSEQRWPEWYKGCQNRQNLHDIGEQVLPGSFQMPFTDVLPTETHKGGAAFTSDSVRVINGTAAPQIYQRSQPQMDFEQKHIQYLTQRCQNSQILHNVGEQVWSGTSQMSSTDVLPNGTHKGGVALTSDSVPVINGTAACQSSRPQMDFDQKHVQHWTQSVCEFRNLSIPVASPMSTANHNYVNPPSALSNLTMNPEGAPQLNFLISHRLDQQRPQQHVHSHQDQHHQYMNQLQHSVEDNMCKMTKLENVSDGLIQMRKGNSIPDHVTLEWKNQGLPQQIDGQDVACLPQPYFERSTIYEHSVSESGKVAHGSNQTTSGSESIRWISQLPLTSQILLLYYHARCCSQNEECQSSRCKKMKGMINHVTTHCDGTCNGKCTYLRRLVSHQRNCRNSACGHCGPVRKLHQNHELLCLYNHASGCSQEECQYPNCKMMKIYEEHIKSVKGACGRINRAKVLIHHKECHNNACFLCGPVRKKSRMHCPLTDGLENSKICEWRELNNGGAGMPLTGAATPISSVAEDLHASPKRLKTHHPSTPHFCRGGTSQVPPPDNCDAYLSSPKPQVPQRAGNSVETMEMGGKPASVEGSSEALCASKDPAVAKKMKPGAEPIIPEQTVTQEEQAMPIQGEFYKAEPEIECKITASSSDTTTLGKPKIKGVSLIESFTPEQVREHKISLKQQSKAKTDDNQTKENHNDKKPCQLCEMVTLLFEPPPLYCGSCGERIMRNRPYYAMASSDTMEGAHTTWNYVCNPCYKGSRGTMIMISGNPTSKAKLEKKQNQAQISEPWVQCDKCGEWQHQICALFNGKRNEGGQAEYTCPDCYLWELENGEREPLPPDMFFGASDLPKSKLSDYIEERLFMRLKQERQERANTLGKDFDDVLGAEALTVRVVSSVDKKLKVKQLFHEMFKEENYPTEFPYKSKSIMLFQKIEGADVLLFSMYVQEFGSECPYPNQRRAYLSYLDSVKYFRPELKTVSGKALRTFVYHEILIGYLDYCKKRGFTSCYIWACPPTGKKEDFILNCHPVIQKIPKPEKLREWYLVMLGKAMEEKIVVDHTNLYDHFFTSTGESKAKVTAARLPYFDGDFWPDLAEKHLESFDKEDRKEPQNKERKAPKKRTQKAVRDYPFKGNSSKDIWLMHKLEEDIYSMKKDLIMVHLQHVCSHCSQLIVSVKRWVCSICINFHICEKCHNVEQLLEKKDRHPISYRIKHSFYPVEVNDVPAETDDKDDIIKNGFFESRIAFLSLCQGNHYQYDTLRRAKHSTMMILYHLKNPTAPAFFLSCIVCHEDIETGQGWHCETCTGYGVCDSCYGREGGVCHVHKLVPRTTMADHNAQQDVGSSPTIPPEMQSLLKVLMHASECHAKRCGFQYCHECKALFHHGQSCKTRFASGCLHCRKMWTLLKLHARYCKSSRCPVPRCEDLKVHIRKLLSDSHQMAGEKPENLLPGGNR